jgi:hypothetical protein
MGFRTVVSNAGDPGDGLQAKKSPRRQASQYPRLPPCQPTPTRWPAVQPATSRPTASIVLTTPWPGTRGYWRPRMAPSLVSESLWQMPQACTLILTEPAPGSAISRSTIARAAPGAATGTARISP